jgi:hypothetical protein
MEISSVKKSTAASMSISLARVVKRSAERRPDGQLPLPAKQPRQHQVRDIGTCDQKQ